MSKRKRQNETKKDKRMTTQKELAIIQNTQKLLREGALRERLKDFADSLGGKFWLDAQGAALETNMELRQLCDAPLKLLDPHAITGQLGALVASALIRCQNHCIHTLPTEPTFAFLAPRIHCCRLCLPQFYHLIDQSDHQIRTGADHECDFCLTAGVKVFWSVRMQYLSCLVLGDCCESCWQLLKGNQLEDQP